MRLIRWTFLLVVLALSLSLNAAPPAPPPAPAPVLGPVPRVAIANPSLIFSKMQEMNAVRAKFEARQKELYQKEVEQRKAIEDLTTQRRSFNPDNPKYREMSEEIDSRKANLQAWAAATKASLDRDQKQVTKELYVKIEGAVAEVAQKNGIDLVIVDGRQDIGNVEEINPEELRRMLNSRVVLYSTPAVDLTEKVIILLDAKYTAEKK